MILRALAVCAVAVAAAVPIHRSLTQADTIGIVTVTGVQADNSSAKVYYAPVPNAIDYRVYDTSRPTRVKYAGLQHYTACPFVQNNTTPNPGCGKHFRTTANDATCQTAGIAAPGGTPCWAAGHYIIDKGFVAGEYLELDVPATSIEWNSLGDGQPHTLVVQAVDALGPVVYQNEYDPATGISLSGDTAAMLGSDSGPTQDGNTSINGQGPWSNNPQVIAQSDPFTVQANPAQVPIPPTAHQGFLDTFDQSEAQTIQALQPPSGTSAVYSLNSGTPQAETFSELNCDVRTPAGGMPNSMPFIADSHFMDMLFDPNHVGYCGGVLTPQQTVDVSDPTQIVHVTGEVDGNFEIGRWWDMILTPAAMPLTGINVGSGVLNGTCSTGSCDQAFVVEWKINQCIALAFNHQDASGYPGGTVEAPNGNGNNYGAQVLGSAGKALVPCTRAVKDAGSQPVYDGLGLDNRSRFDAFIRGATPTTAGHITLFEDGQLEAQADIPAGTMDWWTGQVSVSYAHIVYDDTYQSHLDRIDSNGCYPQRSFWYDNPLTGVPAGPNNGNAGPDTGNEICTDPGNSTADCRYWYAPTMPCGAGLPTGMGYQDSDERHWDNLGFEVLPQVSTPVMPPLLPPQ